MRKLLAAGGVGLTAFMLSTPLWAQPTTPRSGGVRHMAPVTAEHVEEHVVMTEQMRSMGVDPRMVSDPMWAQMRDQAHIQAEELMQEQLDRMLAR